MPGELVRQWIKKIGVARLRAGDLADVADVVVFLAQQCAEKYLKALIQNEGAEPPRLHNLPALLDLLLPVHPDLETMRVSCERLTPYAVAFRYPGEEASGEEAEEAVEFARQIRISIRSRLGIATQ